MATALLRPLTLVLLADIVPDGRKYESAKPSATLIRLPENSILEQCGKKTLHKILRTIRCVTASPQVAVQRIPIGGT